MRHIDEIIMFRQVSEFVYFRTPTAMVLISVILDTNSIPMIPCLSKLINPFRLYEKINPYIKRSTCTILKYYPEIILQCLLFYFSSLPRTCTCCLGYYFQVLLKYKKTSVNKVITTPSDSLEIMVRI